MSSVSINRRNTRAACPEADKLRELYPYFATDSIPSATYQAIGNTRTIAVGAQWLISEQVPADMVHDLTATLWHDNTRKLLDSGHPRGKLIQLETALAGLGVPLHEGAARYYRERDLTVPEAIAPPGEARQSSAQPPRALWSAR